MTNIERVADGGSSTTSRGLRSRLRSLRSITKHVEQPAPLTALYNTRYNTPNSPPVSPDEDAFLKACDVTSGRRFDEASLPTPTSPYHDASIHDAKPHRPSSQSRQASTAAPTPDAPATEAALTQLADSAVPMVAADVLLPPSATTSIINDLSAPAAKLQSQEPRPDSPAAAPADIAPPEPEEQANFSPATKELVERASPQRPAKTVHLPPEDVQEERLRERKEAEEEERRRSESERHRSAHLQAQNELASSPSSTIGAYSAATPMPPQESPDTSPDSETPVEPVLPPKDLRPSPEEQRAKEEHDRLLEAQKEIARREAMGGEPTPDDQLNWEAREAAARDQEEREAREAVNGPEPDSKTVLEQTEAEQVMEDVQSDPTTQLPITPAPSHDEKLTSQPAISISHPKVAAVQDEGDNITVTPRTKLPPIDTGRNSRRPNESMAAPPRMTTRVSSGAMSRRSVSEIIGESPAPAPRTARQMSSPEPSSPMNTQHVLNNSAVQPAVTIQTPRKAARPIAQRSASHRNVPSLDDLAALKGLADDPDRDYLEPLFRIQAHDSPQSNTRPLPDLVKMANKFLSTDDQFTTLHERMDYRILRRIYQLQNANKWSLRQMERAREPDQPVTHMDHMMAEMKWMRKDFGKERKMKKSVCAWLAARCADWVNAGAEERMEMQVKVKPPTAKAVQGTLSDEQVPELEMSGESAPEDELAPATPKEENDLPLNLVVAPELSEVVRDLQKAGKLGKALQSLPVVGLGEYLDKPKRAPLTAVSKFVHGKILPKAQGPPRKRSRFDYEDDAELLGEDGGSNKRVHLERDLSPEEQDVALFHPDNKPIRQRLHDNNAFRPPSEFVMPATSFYEFRNGSQWIWEDDQRLRKLAKEYSFNWSLIADEMSLASRYKSSAERRTPWECFERWVELDSLPNDMRKTMYFKTWFQRLEQSQQAAERRYQTHVANIQAQAQGGNQVHIPQRRRATPTRVEKRKNTRYLWLVDAMRKLAKKRENNAYKQAEVQRAAAQRKSQSDGNAPQRSGPQLTPLEFSRKRQERDMQIAEAQRQHRQKMVEAQQRQIMQVRAQQQAQQQQQQQQQRPGSSASMVPATNVNMNGQLPMDARRPPLPMATRNGHLAVPQVNAQGIPQTAAPMQPNAGRGMPQDMARYAQHNAQRVQQHQYAQGGQQQYGQMPNGGMPSPGPTQGMTNAQQLAQNQALMAQMAQTSAQHQQQQHQQAQGGQGQGNVPNGGHQQQMSASPASMPPPPTPHAQQQQLHTGQLSSGHVPALIAIKNRLREQNPQMTEDQLTQQATATLREQSQHQNSTQQARQNAMNAAAGISHQQTNMPPQQAYGHNRSAFQQNGQGIQMPTNGNAAYMNGTATADQGAASPNMQSRPHSSPQAAMAYANQMRARQMQMMQGQQQVSPSGTHAQLAVNGSPATMHASPNMTPASPSMAYSAGMVNGQVQVPGMAGARPPSRNNTPAMPPLQRIGSSGSVPGVNGMQSPGALQQGSPRGVQAGVAR